MNKLKYMWEKLIRKKKTEQKPEVVEKVIDATFMEANFVFRPIDISEDIWDAMPESEQIKSMQVCKGRLLIGGNHIVQKYWEFEPGIINLHTADTATKISISLKKLDEFIIQTGNVVILK